MADQTPSWHEQQILLLKKLVEELRFELDAVKRRLVTQRNFEVIDPKKNQAAELIPIALRYVSGTLGSQTTKADPLYSIYDVTNVNQLDSVSRKVQGARSKGLIIVPAGTSPTYGVGYVDESGTYTILMAAEEYSTGGCP